MSASKYAKDGELLWSDRKRFMGLPLSFTRYRLVRKPGAWTKLFSDVGFLSSVIDEVNIYRIIDVQFHQSLSGKIFNTGTVTLLTSDESMPTFVLRNVKNPLHVREIFSTIVEEQRKAHGVRMAEFHEHEGF